MRIMFGMQIIKIKEEDVLLSNLNLPGVNEDTLINIEGKKYIEKN
mgnify:CR=1 FL=1